MNKRSMEHVTRAPGYRQINDESYETIVWEKRKFRSYDGTSGLDFFFKISNKKDTIYKAL